MCAGVAPPTGTQPPPAAQGTEPQSVDGALPPAANLQGGGTRTAADAGGSGAEKFLGGARDLVSADPSLSKRRRDKHKLTSKYNKHAKDGECSSGDDDGRMNTEYRILYTEY